MTDAEILLGLAGWLAAGAAHVRALRVRLAVARAAHEIRGPLCAAGLALDAGDAVAGARELQRAAAATEDLDRPRPPRADAVDVRALVTGVLAGRRALARAHGAELLGDVEAAVWLRGDAQRLAQAVSNLVVNAAEHGGARVRVSVTGDGRRVRITVADDGAGLPRPLPALLARRSLGRRGHGLAVAAAVAAAHGGALVHEPTWRGTCLALDLPVDGTASRRGVVAGLARAAAALAGSALTGSPR
jgi:signal transduction histidine kinase